MTSREPATSRRRGSRTTTVIAGVIIAAALLATFLVRHTDSGIAVAVQPSRACPRVHCLPLLRHARVAVRKAGHRESIATHRADSQNRVRFSLDPGRYVLVPLPIGRELVARARPVTVTQGHMAHATLRYERRRR